MVRNHTPTRVRVILFEKSWHQGVVLRVVAPGAHIVLERFCVLFFAFAEGEPEEGIGAALLGGLFLEDILEEVFIPLNQSLTVLLAMLHLFFAIALDALQQRL